MRWPCKEVERGSVSELAWGGHEEGSSNAIMVRIMVMVKTVKKIFLMTMKTVMNRVVMTMKMVMVTWGTG